MSRNYKAPVESVPFPMGNDRDGNNTKDIAGCPHPLEVERGHRDYHESHGIYPSAKRTDKPDYARGDHS